MVYCKKMIRNIILLFVWWSHARTHTLIVSFMFNFDVQIRTFIHTHTNSYSRTILRLIHYVISISIWWIRVNRYFVIPLGIPFVRFLYWRGIMTKRSLCVNAKSHSYHFLASYILYAHKLRMFRLFSCFVFLSFFFIFAPMWRYSHTERPKKFISNTYSFIFHWIRKILVIFHFIKPKQRHRNLSLNKCLFVSFYFRSFSILQRIYISLSQHRLAMRVFMCFEIHILGSYVRVISFVWCYFLFRLECFFSLYIYLNDAKPSWLCWHTYAANHIDISAPYTWDEIL